jgi:very-short-patch-repair endonuclease
MRQDRRQARHLVERSKELRKRMSLPEVLFWKAYKARGPLDLKLRRQVPLLDQYIADFACLPAKVIVEIDGETHLIDPERDAVRDARLGEAGWKVLRISAKSILADTESVIDYVLAEVNGRQ